MITLYHGSYTIVADPLVDFANDNVIDTVEDYTQGIITAEQALGQLRYKSVNHQFCIISQLIIDNCIRFVEAIPLNTDAL